MFWQKTSHHYNPLKYSWLLRDDPGYYILAPIAMVLAIISIMITIKIIDEIWEHGDIASMVVKQPDIL